MKTHALLALFLVSSLTACASKTVKVGDGALQIPFVGTMKVSRFTLDNGLRVLIAEDHSSPTFAYQVWYRVGSRDEVPGRTGLAHLFEHMMFKQTRNLKEGEFDRISEAAGVEGQNASTSRDYTDYIQEFPRDKLDLIAGLEADRMVNLVVDESAFKTEREVVQNERRYRNENSPDGLMYQEIFTVAFTTSNYRWPVIGYQQDLEAMTADDARAFYKSYYSPNHATIVLIGDVDTNQALSTIKKHFASLPAQNAPERQNPVEPPQTAPRRKQLKLNVQVEKLMMAFHIPESSNPDLPAINLAQAVLTGGKSSRLHRALVETGIASSVEAWVQDGRDPSLMIITANLQKGKKATQAEAVINRELKKLMKDPVPEQELKRAKNRFNFEFYDGLEGNHAKAQFLGFYETVAGSFEVGLGQRKKIEALQSQDVLAIAKRYLDPKTRSIVTGVQK